MRRTLCLLAACFLCVSAAMAEDTVLFDFEDAAAVAKWSTLKLVDAKLPGAGEPEAKIELATEGVTSGKGALKITFNGGRLPAITTPAPVEDWTRYRGFKADVTASRTCMVVFRVLTETSKRGRGYNEGVSRWEKAARVEAGKNTVVAFVPNAAAYKKVVTFEITMLDPREGESIVVDHIRLTTERPAAETPFYDGRVNPPAKFKALGTDIEAVDVNDLADQLKDRWVKPEDRSAEEVEAGFRAQFDEIRKTHPKAVFAIFRDGQPGFDPAQAEKVFAGWEDAGTYAHPPMGLTMACFANGGAAQRIEVWSRIRPAFMRVDLTSIPKDAEVLSARLVLVRFPGWPRKDWETVPTCFVARTCNRPWVENEVTVFEYAKDQFWQRYAGVLWDGDDPDSAPAYVAWGPSSGRACTWDFTRAVREWVALGGRNNGFQMYCANKYVDYLYVHSREHPDVKNRPALLVIYEPK